MASLGGVVGYLPLLTLLLPLKAAAVAPDARIGLLASLAFAGAAAASASNIAFGWLSDLSVAAGGTRRGWMASGVAMTGLAYVGVGAADGPIALVAAVVAFQVALNAVLAPLAAAMADDVPDARKGLANGLVAFAEPAAAAAGWVAVAVQDGEAGRLALIWILFGVAAAPLLLGPRRPIGRGDRPVRPRPFGRRDLFLAWAARLLVQTSGVVVFGFALFYFQDVAGAKDARGLEARVGAFLAASHLAAAPLAVLAGMASDRVGARKPFLLGAAVLAASGLACMALAGGWPSAVAGLSLYVCGGTTFLALNAALAMELLPSDMRRGRDLGLLNLANTLPALIGPGLAWLLIPPGGFHTLLLVLTTLTTTAVIAIFLAHENRLTVS